MTTRTIRHDPTSTVGRALVWALRVGWVSVGVLGSSAIDAATDRRSAAVRAVALVGAGVVWLAAALAVAVLGVVPLVLVRTIVPLAVPASAAAWAAGASSATGAGALVAAAITTVVAFNGEVGETFVQASAYGHERRFPLRPPPAYLAAGVLAWLLAAAGLLVGPLALAAGNWLLGIPVTALVGVGAFAWPRWYRLARRWLVVVPAGLVVHDHLVLAETLMVRRQQLTSVTLAPAGTQAADLTGPAPGHVVELVINESVTAFYAATPQQPRGTAIHLTSALIAPTRPGRALAAVDA